MTTEKALFDASTLIRFMDLLGNTRFAPTRPARSIYGEDTPWRRPPRPKKAAGPPPKTKRQRMQAAQKKARRTTRRNQK